MICTGDNQNRIKVELVDGLIKIESVYKDFYDHLEDSTGTILIHHGKAKYPGKYIRDYKKIKLLLNDESAKYLLYNKACEIYEKYNLNKIFVFHSIGVIYKNDPILFLAVEAKDRDSAFDGLREMLEFIKEDKLIKLEECN